VFEKLKLDNNICPCGCGKKFTERKSVKQRHGKISMFYIDSWNFSPQKFGHPVVGRWHKVYRREVPGE